VDRIAAHFTDGGNLIVANSPVMPGKDVEEITSAEAPATIK